jgi:hypothetical protein
MNFQLRTRSRSRGTKRALSVICLLLFVLFGFSGCGRGEFSSLEALPVDGYLNRPGDFLGNTYLLKGRIDSQIKWDESVGRILAVRAESSEARLPVFVPSEVGQNLYVGQVYEMRAIIRDGGLIYVEALRKF